MQVDTTSIQLRKLDKDFVFDVKIDALKNKMTLQEFVLYLIKNRHKIINTA
jgi:hypothetical protein